MFHHTNKYVPSQWLVPICEIVSWACSNIFYIESLISSINANKKANLNKRVKTFWHANATPIRIDILFVQKRKEHEDVEYIQLTQVYRCQWTLRWHVNKNWCICTHWDWSLISTIAITQIISDIKNLLIKNIYSNICSD